MPTKKRPSYIIYILFSCLLILSSCADGFQLLSNHQEDYAARFMDSLKGKNAKEQVEISSAVWQNDKYPESVRTRATYILARYYNPLSSEALADIGNLHQMSNDNRKISIEETLYYDIQKSRNQDLEGLLSLITPDLETSFPYSLIILEAAKRNMLQQSPEIVAKLSTHRFFRSPLVIGATPTGGKPVARTGQSSLALLLPQGNNLANIAGQIAVGAEAAKQNLATNGRNIQIYYIDTQRADWLQQVQSLPADCITIGGPLETKSYNQLKSNGVLQKRVVFSFLPRLPEASDEGNLSWQFFTKPEDQINTMLNVASQNLGIRAFGVFAPENPYGMSMSNLFSQMATARGFLVQNASYPDGDHQAWSGLVKNFLGSTVTEEKAPPTVQAPFDAIFFPDAWRNMDFIISTMHYHGAHTKVMLGNSLWEQSLNRPQSFNPVTFGLTIFPATYNVGRTNPANIQFKTALAPANVAPTDWSALGYDFVMMASALGLDKRPRSTQVNQALSTLQMDYASAPFSWNANGISGRALFVDQPSRSGSIPLDLTKFLTYKNSGGTIPNQGQVVLSPQDIRQQEDQARTELDALINSIVR